MHRNLAACRTLQRIPGVHHALALGVALALLSGCATERVIAPPPPPTLPSAGAVYHSITSQPARLAAVTAHPLATRAALKMFDASGKPVVVGGSAGGGQIVDYISASLIEMLANQRSPAEALARGHVSTANRGKLQLEKGSAAATQAAALSAKGHEVDVVPMTSGLGFLLRREQGWLGAADPRRDGTAQGH